MDKLRCHYNDCPEHHPLGEEFERVTCPTCRTELGLPPIEIVDSQGETGLPTHQH